MQVKPITIAGALLIAPDVFADERGFFKESFSAERYRAAGVTDAFIQDNVSVSKQHVLRGLHGDPRMAKLVQVLRGEAFDVIVDVRKGSPTYGRWEGFSLTEHNHAQLYIPAGCLHGFMAVSDDVILSYKQSATYDPTQEFSVRWNDPAIGILWPLAAEPKLSAKDAAAPLLSEVGRVTSQ
jgi:dTDP-4-dehydrorhamnose 3,5-epimerase